MNYAGVGAKATKAVNAFTGFFAGTGRALREEASHVSASMSRGGWSSYLRPGAIGAVGGAGYGLATSDRRDRLGGTLRGAGMGLGAGLAYRGATNFVRGYAPGAYRRAGAGIMNRLEASESATLRGAASNIKNYGPFEGIGRSMDMRRANPAGFGNISVPKANPAGPSSFSDLDDAAAATTAMMF